MEIRETMATKMQTLICKEMLKFILNNLLNFVLL